MNRFKNNSDISEMMQAIGVSDVNEVLPDGDYETQISAEGDDDDFAYAIFKKKKKEKLTPEQEAEKKKAKSNKYDNIVSKAGKAADTVGKGASIIKGASDAYKKNKEGDKESDEGLDETSENPNKNLYIIIGGVVAAVVIGIIIFKSMKNKTN